VCADAGFAPRPWSLAIASAVWLAAENRGALRIEADGVVLAIFLSGPRRFKGTRIQASISQTQGNLSKSRAPLKGFRLIPAQHRKRIILEHIATQSLARGNGGWSWKFDDKIFENLRLEIF